MSTKIEQVSWGGWPHCYRLSNSEIELILTADVGPRVIRCGFVGGPNVFKEYAEEMAGAAKRLGRSAADIASGSLLNAPTLLMNSTIIRSR